MHTISICFLEKISCKPNGYRARIKKLLIDFYLLNPDYALNFVMRENLVAGDEMRRKKK